MQVGQDLGKRRAGEMGTGESVGRGFTEVFNRSFSNYSQEEPRDHGRLQSQGLYFLWEKKAELIGFQTRLGRSPCRSQASELCLG